MKKPTLWLAKTAVLLAMLILLQALSKPAGQLVTGTLVNAVLALSALTAGVASGAVIALVSPVMAFLLGIAPQILTVPVIMAGNLVFVLILGLPGKQKALWCAVASVAKFAVLYLLVVQVICHLLAQPLLAEGILASPMLNVLPATFGWTQLVTALLGSAVALCSAPLINKALRH